MRNGIVTVYIGILSSRGYISGIMARHVYIVSIPSSVGCTKAQRMNFVNYMFLGILAPV
jgi:hypothetical protein